MKGTDMRSLKALLVGVLGLVAFTVVASRASGSTIRANSGSYTAVAARALTFDPAGFAVTCDLTFAFRARATSVTAASLPTTLVDYGTVSGSVGSCDGGWGLTLLNQPWSYDMVVSGGAGNVTGSSRITIKNAQLEFPSGGSFRCLYAGSIPLTLNAAGTVMTLTVRLPLVTGPLCGDPLVVSGTLALSPAVVLTLS